MNFTHNDIVILNYVRDNGHWDPPQYKGGYDEVPFTHEEYNELTKKIQATNPTKDFYHNFPEVIWVFETGVTKEPCTFVASIMQGQGFTNDLFTKDRYEEYLNRIGIGSIDNIKETITLDWKEKEQGLQMGLDLHANDDPKKQYHIHRTCHAGFVYLEVRMAVGRSIEQAKAMAEKINSLILEDK